MSYAPKYFRAGKAPSFPSNMDPGPGEGVQLKRSYPRGERRRWQRLWIEVPSKKRHSFSRAIRGFTIDGPRYVVSPPTAIIRMRRCLGMTIRIQTAGIERLVNGGQDAVVCWCGGPEKAPGSGGSGQGGAWFYDEKDAGRQARNANKNDPRRLPREEVGPWCQTRRAGRRFSRAAKQLEGRRTGIRAVRERRSTKWPIQEKGNLDVSSCSRRPSSSSARISFGAAFASASARRAAAVTDTAER